MDDTIFVVGKKCRPITMRAGLPANRNNEEDLGRGRTEQFTPLNHTA
jgi:hypothetical protein